MATYPTSRTRRRHSAGEGSVYEIADGRWRGAVTWTEPDGLRHRRIVSGRTSAEARHAGPENENCRRSSISGAKSASRPNAG